MSCRCTAGHASAPSSRADGDKLEGNAVRLLPAHSGDRGSALGKYHPPAERTACTTGGQQLRALSSQYTSLSTFIDQFIPSGRILGATPLRRSWHPRAPPARTIPVPRPRQSSQDLGHDAHPGHEI
jgi:hypothetical protein